MYNDTVAVHYALNLLRKLRADVWRMPHADPRAASALLANVVDYCIGVWLPAGTANTELRAQHAERTRLWHAAMRNQ